MPQTATTKVRLSALEKQVADLKKAVPDFVGQQPLIVPITTFRPESYEVTKPIPVVVRPSEDDYIATFFDANISASGATHQDAVSNLRELLLDMFDILSERPKKELGREPTRQLAVLKEFIRKKS